jgi:hypothetical protein
MLKYNIVYTLYLSGNLLFILRVACSTEFEHEEYGCNVVQFNRSQPTFQRNILTPLKSKLSKKPASFAAWPWNLSDTSLRNVDGFLLHYKALQMTVIFVFTAVRASDQIHLKHFARQTPWCCFLAFLSSRENSIPVKSDGGYLVCKIICCYWFWIIESWLVVS